jgi:DNA-binding CsgD family transcriptional regulator
MLACAQRRFASYKLLKQSTLIFVLLSPLTTLIDDLFPVLFPQVNMPLISLIYLTAIVFVFFMLSPHSYKHLFSVGWLSDLHKDDMELWRETVAEVDRFEKYHLTPREKEIVALLLTGQTRRQIAGELDRSESTVSMHVKNLYDKLEISSLSELFLRYGVIKLPDVPDEDE